jgi:hypothetical protein
MGLCGKHYLILIALWATLNFIYLVWFFAKAQDSKSLSSYLKKTS